MHHQIRYVDVIIAFGVISAIGIIVSLVSQKFQWRERVQLLQILPSLIPAVILGVQLANEKKSVDANLLTDLCLAIIWISPALAIYTVVMLVKCRHEKDPNWFTLMQIVAYIFSLPMLAVAVIRFLMITFISWFINWDKFASP